MDGQAFLPHARELLRAAERALTAVTPGRRGAADRRAEPAGRGRRHPARLLPAAARHRTGRGDPDRGRGVGAGRRGGGDARRARRAPDLDALRLADTEAKGYYADLAAAFGLTIDTIGPSFGVEALLAEIADSARLATFVGEGSRYLWPESYDLRRIPVVGPTPVYPHSVIWRADNPHPVLAHFLDYPHSRYRTTAGGDVWVPEWAR